MILIDDYKWKTFTCVVINPFSLETAPQEVRITKYIVSTWNLTTALLFSKSRKKLCQLLRANHCHWLIRRQCRFFAIFNCNKLCVHLVLIGFEDAKTNEEWNIKRKVLQLKYARIQTHTHPGAHTYSSHIQWQKLLCNNKLESRFNNIVWMRCVYFCESYSSSSLSLSSFSLLFCIVYRNWWRSMLLRRIICVYELANAQLPSETSSVCECGSFRKTVEQLFLLASVQPRMYLTVASITRRKTHKMVMLDEKRENVRLFNALKFNECDYIYTT